MSTINSDNLMNVYVKVVYTAITGQYKINKNSSMAIFINSIKEHIFREHHFDPNSYELVLHSPNSQPFLKDEEKNAFSPEYPNNSVNFYFNTNDVAFYIRYLNRNNDSRRIPLSTVDSSPDECMVCYESVPVLLTSYGCRHFICRGCFQNCLRNHISNCPVCRNPLRSSL
jgi:hypothetical protein